MANALLLSLVLVGALGGGAAALPQTAAAPEPFWPSVFFANFSEQHVTVATDSDIGFYALDLGFDGGKGAQAIYRTNGTSTNCGGVHKDTPCTQLAVGGERYLVFPEKDDCCVCCSWAEGCGPIVPAWTQGAKYKGRTEVNGVQCDDFEIDGFEPNRLLQTPDGKKLCELNNAMVDVMKFDLASWGNTVDPALFALPKAGCSRRCGAVGECQAKWW